MHLSKQTIKANRINEVNTIKQTPQNKNSSIIVSFRQSYSNINRPQYHRLLILSQIINKTWKWWKVCVEKLFLYIHRSTFSTLLPHYEVSIITITSGICLTGLILLNSPGGTESLRRMFWDRYSRFFTGKMPFLSVVTQPTTSTHWRKPHNEVRHPQTNHNLGPVAPTKLKFKYQDNHQLARNSLHQHHLSA